MRKITRSTPPRFQHLLFLWQMLIWSMNPVCYFIFSQFDAKWWNHRFKWSCKEIYSIRMHHQEIILTLNSTWFLSDLQIRRFCPWNPSATCRTRRVTLWTSWRRAMSGITHSASCVCTRISLIASSVGRDWCPWSHTIIPQASVRDQATSL